MDEATVRQLNDINRQFYAATADRFDLLRRGAWPGWKLLLPHLKSPLSVLDIGCGNGRFALFLKSRLALTSYLGIDNNPRLLEHAHSTLTGDNIRFELRDIVENPPDAGTFDLVVAFGVLHHVPGYAQRLALIAALAARVAPGGLLAFACWRFYEFERFREKIVPWPEGITVEPHDYLLDWRRGETAFRYCHYIEDAEHAALIAATGFEEIATYRADGETHNVNRYSILRAPARRHE